MAIDVKQYISELAKSAGVADDKLQAALEVVGNDKIAKALSDDILRHQDYSRNMDGLTAEKKRLTGWYEEQLRVAQSNEKIVTDTTSQLNKYKEVYGDLDGTVKTPVVDTSNFYDKKTVEDMLQRQGQQAIAITKIATKCSTDYYKRFGDVLDMDALEKFTLESGLPLNAAYEKFIEPRVTEIKTKEFGDQLKKAREEGMQEGLSQAKNPTHPGNPEPNGFIQNLRAKNANPAPREGFVEAYNKATAQ